MSDKIVGLMFLGAAAMWAAGFAAGAWVFGDGRKPQEPAIKEGRSWLGPLPPGLPEVPGFIEQATPAVLFTPGNMNGAVGVAVWDDEKGYGFIYKDRPGLGIEWHGDAQRTHVNGE